MLKLKLKPVKEIRGTLALPPDPDLFAVAVVAGLVSRCSVRFPALPPTPVLADWQERLAGRISFERDGDSLTAAPSTEPGDTAVTMPHSDCYCRDFMLFALLGSGVPVVCESPKEGRLAEWTHLAQKARCSLTVERDETTGLVHLGVTGDVDSAVPGKGLSEDELQAMLGLALGRGWRVSTVTDFPIVTPIRHIITALGCDITVRGAERRTDPLARRIKRMKGAKAGAPQTFTLQADFTRRPTEQVDITLPGDEVLASAFLAAKSLIQRGNLIIENVCLEYWASSTLQLIRRMGCSPAIQETGTCSFGQVGMVQLQRYELAGRKTEFSGLALCARSLPSMVALALFAEGESVFRGLGDLHNDVPDGIERIMQFFATVEAHHGKMLPDGFILRGATQYDGFDVQGEHPAAVAAAWATVGARSMGTSSLDDSHILQRWPQYARYFEDLCLYRGTESKS